MGGLPSTVTKESIFRILFSAKISCHVPENSMAEAVTRDMSSSDWLKLEALSLSPVRVDGRKRKFSKTLTSHFQFQSTPRYIMNLFNMAENRFTFLSLILGLLLNQIPCFQMQIYLCHFFKLTFPEGGSIIRLLSIPVSRGGRLKRLGGYPPPRPRLFWVRRALGGTTFWSK